MNKLSADNNAKGSFYDLALTQGLLCYLGRKNGNSWDTMKPLHPLFEDLSVVILFDDDAYKACPGEESNMVLVPSWEGEFADDKVLKVLVDLLLESESHLHKEDVRTLTTGITSALLKDSNESQSTNEKDQILDPLVDLAETRKGNISPVRSMQCGLVSAAEQPE